MKELEEIFKDMPLAIDSLINVEPNETLSIYSGQFTLTSSIDIIILDGEIEFRWHPHTGVYFSGKSQHSGFPRSVLYTLSIDNNTVGEVLISSLSQRICGVMRLEAVFGNRQITVKTVKFSLINVRDFLGSDIKRLENGIKCTKGRLTFPTKGFTIVIDKHYRYSELEDQLALSGGYFPFYTGELINHSSEFTKQEADNILEVFDYFITFLNGRRSAPHFRFGIKDNQVIWSDYTGYHVEEYEKVWSWPLRHDITGLDELWRKFYFLWNESKDNSHALKKLIHWYVESNNYAGFAEGSIILTQTGLELFFNWYLVDTLNLYSDTQKPTDYKAEYKVSEILKLLQIKPAVPDTLVHLKNYVKVDKKLTSGPGAITSIRNALVHGKTENRQKIADISPEVIKDTYELGVLYLELAILYALDFQHSYQNRCYKLTKQRQQLVPWANKHKISGFKDA